MTAASLTVVPCLKGISSLTAAIALWNHEDIQSCTSVRARNFTDSFEWRHMFRYVRESAESGQLPIPLPIKTQVLSYIDKIEVEIREWISYHHENVFFQCRYDYSLFHHLPKLVWQQDGTINYVKTAMALLSSNRLSDIEKFRLMSVYCLEDEMKKMSPSLYSNLNKDNVHFNEYPSIYYWNCHFRHELHLIPGVNATLSLDRLMAQHHKVDNWPAKEYFFDRLNLEEQVDCARSLIGEYGSKFQKLILMKMNEIQRTELYLHDSIYIMDNYSKSSDNYDDLVSTWIELHNLINADQFLVIFVNMLNNGVDNATLKDIWISATDEFKRHVFCFQKNEVVQKIIQSRSEGDLLFTMLSDMNAKIRKKITKREIFAGFCEQLAASQKFSYLDRLLRLCFSESDELAKYKQNFVIYSAAIEDTCSSFYKSGDLKKLNDLLTLLLSDKEVVSEYKKNLLLSRGVSELTTHFFSSGKKDTLNEIIADSLPSEELVKEFHKRLILSDNSIRELRKKIKLVQIDDVKELINSCLESTEDRTTLKKKLLYNTTTLRKILIKYDSSDWKHLLEMCFENDEAVEEFKATLNLDRLFDEVLKYSVFRKYDDRHRVSMCTFKRDVEFYSVYMLLNWYFSSQKEINEYKIKRIFEWMDIETITTLLKKQDCSILKTVMSWFFKYNKKKIIKFKKKFAGERIVEML